jgi:outer membrane protein OmpA-like peptidoglycan-associated protein
LIPGLAADTNADTVRRDTDLAALTLEQWTSLRQVGELRVAPIVFTRGSATISLDSERELQELGRRLQTFPRFYVRVIGTARAEGDAEANRVLAQARAEAAAQYLIGQGIMPQRIRTETAAPRVAGGEAQAVSFFVGQVPY